MNLLQLLLSSMTSTNSVNSVSKKTGTSSKLVSKLLVLAVPLLIKYLTQNASSKKGQQSLLNALTQHKDTDVVSNQLANADEEDGAKIINHILGKDKENVVSNLASQTGMPSNQVSSVLSNIAPSLMSTLSSATTQATANNSADLSGLLSTFAGKKSDGFGLDDVLSLLGGNQKQGALGALTSLLGASKKTQKQDTLGSLLGNIMGQEKADDSLLDGSQLLSLLTNLK